MQLLKWKLINKKIIELAQEFSDCLTKKDIEDITEYLEYNELGIAFEIICFQLYEYDVQLTFEQIEKINNIASQMDLGNNYWQSFIK